MTILKESVRKAWEFAEKKHEGQYRKYSDLPYFVHPKAVARIVEQISQNSDLVAVAFLHDVLEDTDTTEEELRQEFSTSICNIVKELTNSKEDRGHMKKRVYMLDKMSRMSNDALLVKLADRLHNILFINEENMKNEKHFKFIKYYWENTKFIMSLLEKMRYAEKQEITDQHRVLIGRINAVLDFLEVRYSFT